jgi:hypothetical protein
LLKTVAVVQATPLNAELRRFPDIESRSNTVSIAIR